MHPSINPRWFRLFDTTYTDFFKRSLVPLGVDGPAWLYSEAPFALLAHDSGADPRFFYANKTAQSWFGYSWDEFIGMRSRLSAEELAQPERQHLLDTVTRKGFVTGYRGLRIAKSGRRFWISDGTLWQLYDEQGRRWGQAAMLITWHDV